LIDVQRDDDVVRREGRSKWLIRSVNNKEKETGTYHSVNQLFPSDLYGSGSVVFGHCRRVANVETILSGAGRFQVVEGGVQASGSGFEEEDTGEKIPKSELTGHSEVC
jgi:hypothetical protein